MKRMYRVALAAGTAVLAFSPALANHSWSTYHWATTGKLNVNVVRSITPQWSTSVNGAISDWDKSRVLTLNATNGDVSDLGRLRCLPIAGQIRVCNDAYGQRQWLGLATIWLSNGHISQAVTQLNDSYFDMAFYNTDAWRSAVACQEIGHDFGLDHQDENFDNVNLGSCMDYSRNPAGGIYNGFNYGPSNEEPNAHDYDQLLTIYNHNDGFTTAGSATARGAAPAAEAAGVTPSEWGTPIRRDALGRPSVFLKTLGPGRAKVTHVVWTLEARVR